MNAVNPAAAAVDGGAPEYEYDWDFGDRNSSRRPAPEHTFDRAGTFTVTLDVEDATGTAVHQEIAVRVVEGKRRAVAH